MHPSVAELVILAQRFLSGEVDGPTFDVDYRHAFRELPMLEWDTFFVLERLAIACAEYVEIPELREPGDVDDAALAEAARTALRDLGVQ